jgi:hypothetical protein
MPFLQKTHHSTCPLEKTNNKKSSIFQNLIPQRLRNANPSITNPMGINNIPRNMFRILLGTDFSFFSFLLTIVCARLLTRSCVSEWGFQRDFASMD